MHPRDFFFWHQKHIKTVFSRMAHAPQILGTCTLKGRFGRVCWIWVGRLFQECVRGKWGRS